MTSARLCLVTAKSRPGPLERSAASSPSRRPPDHARTGQLIPASSASRAGTRSGRTSPEAEASISQPVRRRSRSVMAARLAAPHRLLIQRDQLHLSPPALHGRPPDDRQRTSAEPSSPGRTGGELSGHQWEVSFGRGQPKPSAGQCPRARRHAAGLQPAATVISRRHRKPKRVGWRAPGCPIAVGHCDGAPPRSRRSPRLCCVRQEP